MKQKWMKWFIILVLTLSCSIQAAAMPETLIPGGNTVGIKLYGEGMVVTEVEENSAAKGCGIRKGDVILLINGEEVHTAEGLRTSLNDHVSLTILRKGKRMEVKANPEKGADGYKLGVYIRDSVAGIGTVTYYDPENQTFGALGHGVLDPDSATVLPLERGVIVPSSVIDVQKGQIGEPGELKGKFEIRRIFGEVDKNTQEGIFGSCRDKIDGTTMPVAENHEIRCGAAEILSNVQGKEIRSYSVEIMKIYAQGRETGRNMLLRVTDPELLSQTGGIVQGMSGSPIIQDGKLVGAVTHVLVNDPTTGYGIFIENMLDAAA